jgi:flagellar protein FlgJ
MIRGTNTIDWSQHSSAANPLSSKALDSANLLSKEASAFNTTAKAEEDPLREAFQDFVGQTLFGQMLQSMRSTVGKPAYFHGGRGEEVFQQQLDAVLVEEISESSSSMVADPMYELFRLQRSQ